MRRLRITIIVLFVLSGIVFLGYNIAERMLSDHTPPVISSDTDTISVSTAAEKSELLAGLTAEDDKDGDLTDSIRISSMSNFTEPGKRTISYAVFDSSNQAATLTRNLEYTDYVSPKIHQTQPLRFSLNEMEDAGLAENMTAEDCIDGDITKQIRVSFGDVYISTAGSYAVTVQVSNSAGDTCSVPVEVTITDPTDSAERGKYYPVLSEYIAYTDVGVPIDPAVFLIGLERNGTQYLFDTDAALMPAGRESVLIAGTVDYNTAGTYTLEYQFTNEDGVTAVTKLAVVVR